MKFISSSKKRERMIDGSGCKHSQLNSRVIIVSSEPCQKIHITFNNYFYDKLRCTESSFSR